MSDSDICSATTDPLLTVAEALARINAGVVGVSGTESVPLRNALGRVLATSIRSPVDLPHARNAAMDGFALNRTDANKHLDGSLKVIGTSWAGRPFAGTIPAGCCVRVMTGALVPDNADAVIMQELVQRSTASIRLPGVLPPEHHIRQPGEDLCRGDTVLRQGRKLTAADMALLAALGFSEVSVNRKARVAFLSTGDELRATTETLARGEIHDSNRYLLFGLFQSEALDARDLGIVRDDPAALRRALSEAAQFHDAIVTTGGASVGEADHVHGVLSEIGHVAVWKIAVKPGKPITFGRIGQSLFFGLPGNPVSVYAGFRRFVRPALTKLTGAEPKTPLRLKVRCGSDLTKAPGRMELQRGILEQHPDGELRVVSAGTQGSHILGALSKANCFIVLEAENAGVAAGETVEVEPFEAEL